MIIFNDYQKISLSYDNHEARITMYINMLPHQKGKTFPSRI